MTITIKLPWYKAAQYGRDFDTYKVPTVVDPNHGLVVTQGYLESIFEGPLVRLPPFIEASQVEPFLLAQFGAEYGKASADTITKGFN
jgi:hypothetical protein